MYSAFYTFYMTIYFISFFELKKNKLIYWYSLNKKLRWPQDGRTNINEIL